MDIETPEWQGNPNMFAKELFERICTALKKQLDATPKDKHVMLIRDAGRAFDIRLHGASYGFARNPASQKIIDNLQIEYASRFSDMEMDVKG